MDAERWRVPARSEPYRLARGARAARSRRDPSDDPLDAVPAGLLVFDAMGIVRRGNRAAERLLGLPVKLIAGRPLTAILAASDVELLLASAAGPVAARRLRLLRRDGSWCSVAASLERWDGRHWVLLLQELPEYDDAPLYDPHSGLPAEALLLDRVHHGLARLRRRLGSLALLVLELRPGPAGDDEPGRLDEPALAVLVERLRICLRPGDTLARLGEWRLAVLLEDIVAVDEALAVARRVLAALEPPIALAGGELRLAGRAGIAVSAADESSAEELVADASAAAAQAVPGAAVVFDADAYDLALLALARERDLRQALAHDELRCYVQPLVELASRRIVAVQALPYWDHPQQGLLAPAQFLDLAETSDLGTTLSRWLLREAAQQVRHWQEALPARTPLALSVRLSARHLRQGDFVADVEDVLLRARLAERSLIVEVVSDDLAGAGDEVVEGLRRLRRRGAGLALAEFGGDSASLALLGRVVLDYLKLAPLVTREMPADGAPPHTLVAAGRALGARVVATGVSTPAQLSLAAMLDCDLVQGNLLAPPNPSDAFERLLRLTGGVLPPAQ